MRGSTLERFHSSAQSVTRVFQYRVPHSASVSLKRSVLDGASVTRASINQTTKEKLEDPYRREAIQILQVYEDILTSRQLEET